MDPCISCRNADEENMSDIYQSPIRLNNEKNSILMSYGLQKSIFGEIYCRHNSTDNNWYILNEIKTYHNDLCYCLKQFHFHQPGEHDINNTKFPLELHFVFESQDNYGYPNILVIGFVFIISEVSSDFVRNIVAGGPFYFPDVHSYYTYPGSLTTPPFNINVNWVMTSVPLTISRSHLTLLINYSKPKRLLQARNGRNIVFVDTQPYSN
jgi:carbonic anhydrase